MSEPNQTFDLHGRVAIVTGASKGIGAAIARDLAAAGAKVVVSSRKQEAVDEVAAAIKADGKEALGIVCHVGKIDQLDRLVDKTLEAYSRIDILVNNAATNPSFGGVLELEAAAFDKIFEINLRSPLLLAQRCHPHLAKGGKGSVINISSIGGIKPEPGLGVYSASKAALISLTQVMAKEWGSDGIRANVICPGLIRTKFSAPLWANEDAVEMAVGRQPIRRIGEPEELGPMALFLASDASSYCTGGVYLVDGGHVI